MPLIILGLIVVLGAALLIYYQLGPKVTLRLKSGFGGFGGGPGAGSAADEAEAQGEAQQAGSGAKSEPDDEKVLFIFGDGAREERPLHNDDGQDSQDKGE